MDLEKDIQKAIEANLPAATAKVLASRLTEGEKAIKLVEELEQTKTDLRKDNQRLINENHTFAQKESEVRGRELEADKREKELFKKETEATVKKEYSDFKNPVVRQHTSTNVPVIIPKDQYGDRDYSAVSNMPTTSMTTTEND